MGGKWKTNSSALRNMFQVLILCLYETATTRELVLYFGRVLNNNNNNNNKVEQWTASTVYQNLTKGDLLYLDAHESRPSLTQKPCP